MKKYKNISLALWSYVGAIVWFFVCVSIGNALVGTTIAYPQIGRVINIVVLAVFFLLLLTTVFLGFKSNKAKESSWAGNILMVLGIVTILVYLLLMSGFMGY